MVGGRKTSWRRQETIPQITGVLVMTTITTTTTKKQTQLNTKTPKFTIVYG